MRSPSPLCVSPPPDRCADHLRTFRIARRLRRATAAGAKRSASAWHSLVRVERWRFFRRRVDFLPREPRVADELVTARDTVVATRLRLAGG